LVCRLNDQNKLIFIFVLSCTLVIVAIVPLPLNPYSSILANVLFAQQTGNKQIDVADSLITFTNLKKIETQINLANLSLLEGNLENAFQHVYFPHSVTFPELKPLLSKIDSYSSRNLEALLADLTIKVRSSKSPNETFSKIGSDVAEINKSVTSILNSTVGYGLFNDKGFRLQTSLVLLEDAIQNYRLFATLSAQDEDGSFNHENALGLVNNSMINFKSVSDLMSNSRGDEISSFYHQLKENIIHGLPFDTVASVASAIERDFSEELTLSAGSESNSEQIKYFSTIRELLNSINTSLNQGDYKSADAAAIKAYIDNYEYLESPIEKHDSDLMKEIELEMRERLRQQIREERSPQEIANLINIILAKLNMAEDLLRNDPSYNLKTNTSTTSTSRSSFADIEGLRQGLGTYAGETRQMGEADDPAKASVRNSVDQIRFKLSDMLKLYQNQNYEGAHLTAQSAYLDSYETIEIPLRPIDPDFTLEMEIKFANLRNLIQQHTSFQMVEANTLEIRRGLDESERLVSGVGIVAPAIAFSTSFSIIFREGLESALIIGAILTYLEASRNSRFKRHVYYGILFAATATAATWFVAQYLIEISGASRELIEAIAGLSAVAVLFWVSFWVLNKIETKKWIEFVKAKVWKATTTGSVIVFVALAFFTVYREGFETVLFYQAMLSFAKYMELYVIAGMTVGLAVIIGVGFLVNRLGRRLPLRALFALTMGIGAYMSIAFMGNTIRELQELGVVPVTPLVGVIPRLDINLATMTGIHPTLESVIAQCVLLSIYLIGSIYILLLKPRRQQAIDNARKSMADLHDLNKHQQEGR
jgi:high-affinity iron transporter